MKRILLPLLLIACLFLSGCGDHAAEKRFTDFSEGLAAKETLSFCADMRVEYADRTLEFTLAYARDADGQTITVQKPERIAGIRAHLAPGSNTLEFEGLILDTGPLDPYGLTPMNALPKLVDQAVAANSAAIDGASGASMTSEGFRQAVAMALELAK